MRYLFKTLLIGTVLALVAAASFLYFYLTQPIPLEAEKSVLIERGYGRVAIAQKLAQEGVIQYPQLFAVIGYAMGKKPILAGEYDFLPGMNPLGVMQLLESGKVVLRKVTVPEGYTVWQVLQLVGKAEGLTGDLPADVAEGSLFPETYYYIYGDSKKSVIERMEEKQKQVVGTIADIGTLSKEQVLTLASIVEKETGVGDERAKVAGVFMNRLKKGMMLQTDPTVLYAVSDHTGVLDRPLTRKDLAVESPYNTYKVAGLPPTPICNPGKAAIDAVLNPEATDALYFVATGEGGHFFARTVNEHVANIAKYKAALKEQKQQ